MPIVPQFKQIRPVDFQTSSNILGQAGRSMERGLDAFGDVLGDLRGRATARKAFASEGNDRAIAANLETFKSLGDIQQAEDAGSFTDTNLFKQFGSNYSQKGAKDAFSAAKSRLKGKATDEATSIANQAATETGDMTKGTAAFRQHMLSLGAKAGDVDAATNKWAAGNEALKGEISRTKEVNYENTFSKYQDDISTPGVDPDKSAANAAKSIADPKQRRRFVKEAKDWNKTQSSLSLDQKAELENQRLQNEGEISIAKQRGDAALSAAQANLYNPISKATAAHFEDVADPGGSVVDWFKTKLDAGLGTSGAVEDISNKFREMIGDKIRLSNGTEIRLNDKEVAGIMVESWQATYGEQQNMIMADLDMDALEEQIKRRVDDYATYRQKQSDISTAKLRHDNSIQSMRTKSRDQLLKSGKDTRASNRTGKNLKTLRNLSGGISNVGPAKKTAADFVKSMGGGQSPKVSDIEPISLNKLLSPEAIQKVAADDSPLLPGSNTPQEQEAVLQQLKEWRDNQYRPTERFNTLDAPRG